MVTESWATSAGTQASMLGNRRTDTKPEKALRSALHAAGYRFRKDYRLDLGNDKPRPDIVFPRAKVAVFVDGCYWDAALLEAGWAVVRVWEHTPVSEAVSAVVGKLSAEPR